MSETFTPINEVGEFGLIDRLQTIVADLSDPDLIMGIGDDAAVYRLPDEETVHVITTDALLEGVHFDRLMTPMEHLGYKAIAVNVSDVVAMNAEPRYATIAVGIPAKISVEMMEAFYQGVRRACEKYGLVLVGGDTTAAHTLCISVTVVGEARMEDIIFRRGARPGDLLCVSGDLGAAYAGLKILLEQRRALKEKGSDYQPDLEPYRYVIQRQLLPEARLDVIRDWRDRGVRPRALIDVSDGLASEVHHLCRHSNCGAIVYASAIPVALETREVADHFAEDVDTYALFGGEDYELLFALPPEQLELLDPTSFNVIGEFLPADQGVQVQTPEGAIIPLEPAGYQHFREENSGSSEDDPLSEGGL